MNQFQIAGDRYRIVVFPHLQVAQRHSLLLLYTPRLISTAFMTEIGVIAQKRRIWYQYRQRGSDLHVSALSLTRIRWSSSIVIVQGPISSLKISL